MSNKNNNEIEALLNQLQEGGIGCKVNNKENLLKDIERELEFEEAMLRGGIRRFNDTIKTAKEKGQESSTLYGLVMQQKYISKLSDIINTDVVRMINGQADVRQTSLKRICECLPKSAFDDKNEFIQDRPQVWDSCSLIILKNTLDGISFETTLNKLAIQIATGLQMEAKLGLFKETNKVQFKKVENALNRRNLPQNKKRYHHKERVWVYNMNKHNLDFKNWSKDDKIHLGAKCINYLELLGLVQHELRTTAKKRTIYYVTATEKMLEEIRNFNINNEALHPKYMPMIMPPKNWNSPFSGGYYGKKFNNENDKEKIANALQFDKSK